MRDENQKPGLPAVYELRAARKAGRFARVSPGVVLYSALALAAVMGAYSWWTGYQLGQQRDAIAAQWKDAEYKYSAPLKGLSAAVDAVFADARGPWLGDSTAVAPVVLSDTFYVRVRRADLAKSTHAIAIDSSRDAAVACMAQPAGVAAEAVPNLHAFENGRALFSADWLGRMQAEDRAVRVGLYGRQLLDTVLSPNAAFAKVAPHATGVLLVVDEDDAGEASVYYAHVGSQRIGRMKTTVQASVTEAGSHDEVDPKIWAAAQRQAMGCALGRELSGFLSKASHEAQKQ